MLLKHGLNTMAPTVGLLQYKENQIYNEKASFLIAWTSRGRSWTLGNVLLKAEFRLLATNFICTHLYARVISICMHTLVGLETLRD